MKRILYILTIIITGFSLNSCDDDLLDKTPIDGISDADFWNTESDLALYLNQLYGTFAGWPSAGAAPSYDIGTDIIVPHSQWFGASSTNRLDGKISIPTSGGGWSWTNVRRANYFLENAERVESGNLLDHYIGEGHFFRAYFYFELFKSFGDLPIITEVVAVEDEDLLYGVRSSRTEVANFILSELDLAIEKMETADQVGPSRLNKDVAAQFKARVAIYEGTWEKYHQGTDFSGSTDGTDFLQQAADAAYSVIERGRYSLYQGTSTEDVYYDLSVQTDYSGNPEVMLYKHYDYLTYNIQNSLWNQPNLQGMSREMTQLYLASDGQPIGVSPLFIGDETLDQIEVNRDPRLAQTLMAPGDLDIIALDGSESFFTIPDMDRCPTGYSIEKWRSKEIDATNQRTRDIGYILFRYAESLLIYAEAKAELGTITQEDVDLTINQLRSRVGMPDLNIGAITADPNWPDYGYTIPDYLQEIRRERVVELFGEGNRLYDLMRWRAHNLFVGTRPIGTTYTTEIEAEYPNLEVNSEGYLDPLVNVLESGSGFGFNPDRDYLLPLPIDELTINENLTQNPGWE
jgi:hypothetical protein